MPTPEELLAQSLAKFQTANRIDGSRNSYRKDSPAEYTKVIAYLQGGARPSGVVSDMGMGLMLEEDARRALIEEPPPPPPPPAASIWSAGMETGDLSEWYYPSTGPTGNYGGGLYNSGVASATASQDQAHSGSWSMKASITTPSAETSGVRAFRWLESRAHREAYYSAWFYFPVQYTLTGNPNTGQFWNLFQFKSRSTDGRIDPIWGVYAGMGAGGKLYIRAGWGWGGTPIPGPYASDGVGGKNYPLATVAIPVARWVHFKAFLRQSKDFDGTFKFWQDGELLIDFSNVRTSFDNPNYNSWHANDEWSVNNYSDGLSPNPGVIYIDDAAISLSEV